MAVAFSPSTASAGKNRPADAANASSSVAGGFLKHPTLPTGYIPTAVVSGDFNEDGKMDLAVSNGGDGTIYIFPGNGDDTFQIPEVIYTAGPSPVWITAASLRNNGHVDLIVADGDSNQLEIYLGKGDGTFQPGPTTALPQTPTSLVAGDFNNDGKQDVAVGYAIAGGTVGFQFQVLLGDGSGDFPASSSPPSIDNGASYDPIVTDSLTAGDLNKDGFLDVVTAVYFGGAIPYLNRQGTQFTDGNLFGPNDAPLAVALGDMNEDGCLDAIESGAYGYFTVALGNCTGAFTQPAGFTAVAGDLDGALSVADIDGDGHLDVVGMGMFFDIDGLGGGGFGSLAGYLVSVARGDGKGNLAQAAVYPAGTDIVSIAIADFNGDNKPEIVTANPVDNNATMLLNDGSGNLGSPQGETVGYVSGVTNAPLESAGILTADLNGDGKADLLFMEYGQEGVLPNQITSLLSDGQGNFAPPVRSAIAVGAIAPFMTFTTGDFRGSGRPDVVLATQYQAPNVVAVFPSNGDGSFGTPVTLANVPNPYNLATGDFNHDGKLDVAVYGSPATGQASSEFDIFLGNGDGTFQQLPAQTFPLLSTQFPSQLIAGDFNHDGKVDLLVGYDGNDGQVSSGDDLDLAVGNGDGTFQPPATLFAHFGPVVVADLNHDGYLDLVQARDPAHFLDSNDYSEYIADAVTIYLGGPGGTFQQQPTYSLPGAVLNGAPPALVGDFNGDGILDIASIYLPSALGQPWKKKLQVLQGVGDGTFELSGQPYELPAYDTPIAGGNFRGGGYTDLVDLVGYTPSVNTIPSGPAPALDIAFDSEPLLANQGTATVTLALPAKSAQTVTLSASDPAVQLPSELGFNSGERAKSFTFTLGGGFDATHLLALSASVNGQTATAFAAKAGANSAAGAVASVGGFTVEQANQLSIAPGEDVHLALNLASVAGYSGIFQGFSCAGLPPGASCTFSQDSVTLYPGQNSQVGFVLHAPATLVSGTYSLQVGATDGSLSPSAPLSLSIGGFSMTVDPSTIVAGVPGALFTNVTATFTGGFIEQIAITCSGLPAQVTCSTPGDLGPTGTGSPQATEMLSFTASSVLTPKDYPFQIVGTTPGVSQTVNAIFRVVGLSGTISPASANLSNGQSAQFTVTLTSLNHFVNSVAVVCQDTPGVTCSTGGLASLTDNGSATVTLTVAYQAQASATAHADPRPTRLSRAISPWLCLLVVPCLPLVRRKQRVFSGILALLFCLGVAACGGGSAGTGSTGSGSNPPPATQTLSVPLSATATYPSGTLQQSIGTITLTVPK